MNNLATIQTVKNVRHHPNADALDLIQVLGWQVVTKRGEFKEGDLCIYIVIDTVVPDRSEFEFLRNKNFRIKPIRLRGEYSAGIVFPLSILPPKHMASNEITWTEGEDVTDILAIKHYEKPVPTQLAGQAFGTMPGFLRITDEDNLRSNPGAIPELYGRPYYITRKEDGSSGTYFIHNGEFGVCSRRIHLKDTEGNGFWNIARKYDIENKLKTTFATTSVAIQGEVVGPGVQKNPLGIKELDFKLFNIFDIVQRTYLDYAKIVEFCNSNNIPMVPIIDEGAAFHYTLEELIALANAQKYDTGGPAEGIVIRPKESFYSPTLKKYWSGKIINEHYKE